MWAQAREAHLHEQLLQRHATAQATIDAISLELAQRTQDAKTWLDMSEQLATQQRSAALLRALSSMRHRRAKAAWHDWLTGMGLMLAMQRTTGDGETDESWTWTEISPEMPTR